MKTGTHTQVPVPMTTVFERGQTLVCPYASLFISSGEPGVWPHWSGLSLPTSIMGFCFRSYTFIEGFSYLLFISLPP